MTNYVPLPTGRHRIGKLPETGHLQPMKKQLFLLGIVFVSAVWLLFQLDLSAPNLFVPEQIVKKELKSPGFLIHTKGCRIQELDPYDKKIQTFLHPEDIEHICNKFKIGRLIKSDSSSVFIDWSLLNNISTPNLDDLECKSCEFWRVERSPNENGSYPTTIDTSYRFADNCKKFENFLQIEHEEFIKVECTAGGKTIYADFFAFPRKDKVKTQKFRKKNEANVLLIGVDSVSRLNLYRQMPKTVNFLNTKVKSVEMLGYNKVGDNTFPNLVPVLSGLSEKELSLSCWPNWRTVFDDCPMIWKKYKDAKFHTGYAEDSALIGLFNYQKIGFRKQPTDYYGQIFSLVSESQLGSEKQGNTYLCVGNRFTVELLLEQARNFAVSLKEILTWGMFWTTSLSHDFLNYPRYGDDLHLNFMEELLKEGIFNTTIFVYLSDHGIRWGEIRETYQGYIEERLPFVWIAYPQWFENQYSLAIRNLRTNRRRLTTPFDLHETLVDLLNLTNINNEAIKHRSQVLKESHSRGISLFLPIPESRTCKDAGITDNWCACHTSKEISAEDPTVVKSSQIIINHLNNLLEGYKLCSKLRLNKIHSARMEVVNEENANKDKLIDYVIVLETLPGQGLFEATIRYTANREEEANATVLDPVSRLNTYGNQSLCINHYALKLYCYCTEKLAR